MIALPEPNKLSPEEYLEMEEKSPIKHEYIDGKIYPMWEEKLDGMAGASDAHVTIAGNLFALLRNHVRGTECRVYISDMKAHIERKNIYYYPDVMVTCHPQDQETSNYKRFPCLIVEVLSDSTEAFDRGDKFADYQTLDNLKEYVLISTKRQRVDCFRRSTEGLWILQSYSLEQDLIELKSIQFECRIDALHEDVVFS